MCKFKPYHFNFGFTFCFLLCYLYHLYSLASKLNVFEAFSFKGQVFNLTCKRKAALQLQPLTFSEIMWLCQFAFKVKPILKCKLELIDFIVRIARLNGVWRKKWRMSGTIVKFEIVFFYKFWKKKILRIFE